jgi:hypothetical protein
MGNKTAKHSMGIFSLRKERKKERKEEKGSRY